MSKVTRLEMDFGASNKIETKRTFRNLLKCYLTYRSFDTGHSIGNCWKGPMKSNQALQTDCWAEWLYVYDPFKYTLKITCIHSGKSKTLDILDTTQWEDWGILKVGSYYYGEVDIKKAAKFAMQLEKELSNE